jgi:hypothetical protein
MPMSFSKASNRWPMVVGGWPTPILQQEIEVRQRPTVIGHLLTKRHGPEYLYQTRQYKTAEHSTPKDVNDIIYFQIYVTIITVEVSNFMSLLTDNAIS